MPSNIEIKARVSDRDALFTRVAAVATDGPFEIHQHDTFFVCADGRLKLRDFGDGTGELIFYRRADTPGPEQAFHRRTPTADPAGLRRTLAQALGVRAKVVKTRTLYLAGRTRIHVDRVAGLGDFIELEVVLAEGEPPAAGRAETVALMQSLAIADEALVEQAYVDLLPASRTSG